MEFQNVFVLVEKIAITTCQRSWQCLWSSAILKVMSRLHFVAGLAACLILFCLSLASSSGGVSLQSCEDRLVRSGFTREDAPEYWSNEYLAYLKKYKNDDAFYSKQTNAFPQHKTINLGESESVLNAISASFCAKRGWPAAMNYKPTIYAERVLMLRSGDTVVFGEHRFTLKKFIGRGNATHVWEIEGRDDAVLKIPFYAGPVESEHPWIDSPDFRALGTASARAFMRHYVARYADPPKDVPRVLILEYGHHHEYVLVSKVRGSQTGAEFLLSELQKKSSNEEILLRKQKLIHYINRMLTERAKQFPSLSISSDQQAMIKEARQFLWQERDWILVDWDY